MDDLIRSCLRMKPHRYWLARFADRSVDRDGSVEHRTPGGSMTIHANNAMEGLNRLYSFARRRQSIPNSHFGKDRRGDDSPGCLHRSRASVSVRTQGERGLLVRGTMENASRLNSFRHSLLLHDKDIQPGRRMSMVKKMRNMTGRLVDFVTGKRFLTMAGLALVSNALAYASTSTTGFAVGDASTDSSTVADWAVAAGISVVGIAAGGMALVFGGELSEFAKRSCYAVIATGVIVGAGTIMSTLFSVPVPLSIAATVRL